MKSRACQNIGMLNLLVVLSFGKLTFVDASKGVLPT